MVEYMYYSVEQYSIVLYPVI